MNLDFKKDLLNRIQKALTKTEKTDKPNIKIKKSSSSKYKFKTLKGQIIETEKRYIQCIQQTSVTHSEYMSI